MMNNLNELAKEYHNTKSQEIKTKILKLVDNLLSYKAKLLCVRNVINYNGKYYRINTDFSFNYEDLYQDYRLFILELLERYNGEDDFRKYFFSSIWQFIPYSINQESLINSTRVINETQMTEEEEYLFKSWNSVQSFLEFDNQIYERLSKIEQQIVDIILLDYKVKQSDIAKMLGVSRQRIGQHYNSIGKMMKITIFKKTT